MGGVPQSRAVARGRAQAIGIDLGREAEVGLNLSFDLPPFWSTSSTACPSPRATAAARRRPGPKPASSTRASTDPLSKLGEIRIPPSPRSGARVRRPRAPGAPAAATEGPTRQRIRHVRARYRSVRQTSPRANARNWSRRCRPHEQIVARARGLDASRRPARRARLTGDSKRDSARTLGVRAPRGRAARGAHARRAGVRGGAREQQERVAGVARARLPDARFPAGGQEEARSRHRRLRRGHVHARLGRAAVGAREEEAAARWHGRRHGGRG